MRCTYCSKVIWPWQLRCYGSLNDQVVYGLEQHLSCHNKHMQDYWRKVYDDMPERKLFTSASMGKPE